MSRSRDGAYVSRSQGDTYLRQSRDGASVSRPRDAALVSLSRGAASLSRSQGGTSVSLPRGAALVFFLYMRLCCTVGWVQSLHPCSLTL